MGGDGFITGVGGGLARDAGFVFFGFATGPVLFVECELDLLLAMCFQGLGMDATHEAEIVRRIGEDLLFHCLHIDVVHQLSELSSGIKTVEALKDAGVGGLKFAQERAIGFGLQTDYIETFAIAYPNFVTGVDPIGDVLGIDAVMTE